MPFVTVYASQQPRQSDHIHLLVADDKGIDVIPDSIKLIAGRTGQEFNQRKARKGAYWEDRYHATAVEDGDHLLQCIVYIDMNMVRAGVVKHPAEWPFSGYSEIQHPKRKNGLINYHRLREYIGFDTYGRVQSATGIQMFPISDFTIGSEEQ